MRRFITQISYIDHAFNRNNIQIPNMMHPKKQKKNKKMLTDW